MVAESGLKIKIVRKIEEIPAEDWDKVFPNVLESYDLFKTLDESDFGQFTFYYIMVYDRKMPVGATACFLTDYSLDTSIRGPLKRITSSIKRRMPNIFSIKALVCGSPVGQGRIGIAGHADGVINAILRCMEHIARKNRAAIVAFKDFDKTYTKTDILRWADAYPIDLKSYDPQTGISRFEITQNNLSVKNLLYLIHEERNPNILFSVFINPSDSIHSKRIRIVFFSNEVMSVRFA